MSSELLRKVGAATVEQSLFEDTRTEVASLLERGAVLRFVRTDEYKSVQTQIAAQTANPRHSSTLRAADAGEGASAAGAERGGRAFRAGSRVTMSGLTPSNSQNFSTFGDNGEHAVTLA